MLAVGGGVDCTLFFGDVGMLDEWGVRIGLFFIHYYKYAFVHITWRASLSSFSFICVDHQLLP